MVKFGLFVLASLLAVGLIGCGGGYSNKNKLNTNSLNNGANNIQQTVSQPGSFKNGEFGRIDLTDEKYDDLGINDGNKVVEDAIFVDIRNRWERDEGQPVEVVKDIVIYEIRNEQRVGDHLNQNFVQDMTTLVNNDKNKKIVLICHTGSRTQKAAKLLSENGFTNVYDIKDGYVEWEKHFHTDSYINLYK